MLRVPASKKKPNVRTMVSGDFTEAEVAAAREFVNDPVNNYAIEFDQMTPAIKVKIMKRLREQQHYLALSHAIINGKAGRRTFG